MIIRNLAICNSCDKNFILRAVVPNSKNSLFAYPCPSCQIRLKGQFKLKPESPNIDIISSNFSILKDFSISKTEKIDPLPIVTISTEIPIHKLHHKNNLLEGGSPILWLPKNMGTAFIEWIETVKLLQNFDNDKFSELLQRLVNYASIENWEQVENILEELDQDIKAKDNQQVIYMLHKLLSSIYVPLIKFDEMVAILDEYYVHLNTCINNHKVEYVKMLNNYYSIYGFSMFKKQVYETYYKIIKNFDSFITGLFHESIPENMKSDLANYRLFRDDYDMIKSLYQDIFELNSKSMFYIGSIVNLSKRNSPCHFASGINSCNKFRKLTSFKKLEVLNEFTLLKDLISNVSRPMRNSIGHFGAEYDYVSGNLIFEDGSSQNYIEFLGQFLWSVKSIWFLLVIVEKIQIDYYRLNSILKKT